MKNNISQVLIVDNGAHTLKVGFSTDTMPTIIPNCISKIKSERKRPFIGDQLDECKDYSSLFYILPFSRGYLVNWDVQRQIWDYLFRTKLKLVADQKNRYSNIALIITEPVYNFKNIRENMIEFLFENYGFGKILIVSAPQLAAFKYLHMKNGNYYNGYQNGGESPLYQERPSKKKKSEKEKACLVVDSGFSFTHVVPFVDGIKVKHHMKRIDIGGKALTNHLKEVISYRQLNVLDETFVVNQMKEDCCYVSTQYWQDMKTCSKKRMFNNVAIEYILPDYVSFKRGFVYDRSKHTEIVTPEHQRILINNERFQVPELLFNPGDVNLNQLGIPHTIRLSVSEFNPDYQEPVLQKINEESGSMLTRDKPETPKYVEVDEDFDEDYEEEISSENDDVANKEQLSNGCNSNGNSKPSDNPISFYNDINIQAHLYKNILLIGGNCLFPNFHDRLIDELRSVAPDRMNIHLEMPKDPIEYAWSGGQLMANIDEEGSFVESFDHSLANKLAVSYKDYKKGGLAKCWQKFESLRLPTF